MLLEALSMNFLFLNVRKINVHMISCKIITYRIIRMQNKPKKTNYKDLLYKKNVVLFSIGSFF
jgi:hypothetical protein